MRVIVGSAPHRFMSRRRQCQSMIEILYVLTAIVVLLAAAHKGKRRRYRRYLKGIVDEQLSLGTLAGRTLVSSGFDETVSERTYASSIVASWSLKEVTVVPNNGPLLVGVAHSDYGDSEIEQVIENTGSWDEGDLIAQEIAKRKIRIIGTFGQTGAATSWDVLNTGKPIKTKLGWILTTGDNLRLWAYNLGTAAFSTTVPELDVQGHINLFPT